jgi:hypothetical protein
MTRRTGDAEVVDHNSFAVLTDAQLATVIGMSPSAMRVYLVIRREAAGRKQWFIRGGLDAISTMAGISRRAAERAVADLVDANLLEREHRTHPNGGTAATRYTIVAPTTAPAEPPKRHARRKRSATDGPDSGAGHDNTTGPDNTVGGVPDSTVGGMKAPTTLSGPQRKKKKKRIEEDPQPPHSGGLRETPWSTAQQSIAHRLQGVDPPTAYRAAWAEAVQRSVVGLLEVQEPLGLDDLAVSLPPRSQHDLPRQLQPVADALYEAHGHGAYEAACAEQDAPPLLRVRIARTAGMVIRRVVHDMVPAGRDRRRAFLASRLSAEVDAALRELGVDVDPWPENEIPADALLDWTPPHALDEVSHVA